MVGQNGQAEMEGVMGMGIHRYPGLLRYATGRTNCGIDSLLIPAAGMDLIAAARSSDSKRAVANPTPELPPMMSAFSFVDVLQARFVPIASKPPKEVRR
jgi:hypothetical protein